MAPLAATKLRNALRRIDPDLEVKLKNIRVNSDLRGCSGFVVDPATSKVVYVNTESLSGTQAMLRTATSTRDFTGGRNHFVTHDELPGAVVDLLGKEGPDG